eukprot:600806-Amphidinium_carterae.1
MILGFEPDLSASLTPDWTWERYPRGVGEVACREDEEENEGSEDEEEYSQIESEWEELPLHLQEEMTEAQQQAEGVEETHGFIAADESAST